MALPFFYIEDIGKDTLVLDEDTSKHVTGVLRMKNGDELLLTNGKGLKAKAIIIDDHRKRCTVKKVTVETEDQKEPKVAIAISLVKNAARFEWFLEKATEIGVSEIIPLLCERTEKEKFRFDRLHNILISAMLQSQQTWLPLLQQPIEFSKVFNHSAEHKLIAHCLEEEKRTLTSSVNPHLSTIILIGPEGDFTANEINQAITKGFIPVTLGSTRLRTETAGMVAATLLCNRGS